ncbi:MAG: hypothetical protein EXQ96_02570 [Alphaproteobacteria bacterium]|nr:hypothetical protein [Alphaproteobacteria bacterium]
MNGHDPRLKPSCCRAGEGLGYPHPPPWRAEMSGIGTLELIRESLVAVVNEMRANIVHSSYSSIIYEGRDFSCGLLAADGRQVAQSLDDNPLHIFAVPYSIREIIKVFKGDIHDGDIFFHNCPYTGGTHLNDVLMLHPIFFEGELVMFAGTRCHWGDVGGMTPGSLSGRVREIYQEGLRVVPTRICDRGKMNQAFLDLLFNNMRVPAERRGDFNTMLGTGRKAEEHVLRLFKRFGGRGLLTSIDDMIRRSAEVMRGHIRRLPRGVYQAEGYVESDGHTAVPLVARLKLTIGDGEIIADFTGSSPQTAGPTNVGPAMALTAVGSIVKSFLDPKTPLNHGSFEPLTVIAPEGSFVNARSPAPCGGMVEVKALLDMLMAHCLGRAMPEMMVGELKQSANHVYLAGPTGRGNGNIFILYEYPGAGTGGWPGGDGNNATRGYTEGDFNSTLAVEIVESQMPLRVEQYRLREGSCGDGEYRGGLGVLRDVRLLGESATLSVLADKNVIPPGGTQGGRSGGTNRFIVVRDGEIVEPSPIPGKVSGFQVRQGDILRMQSSGGGGYGDSLDRDPNWVARDAKLGYISREQARARFGVVLRADGAVDEGATRTARERLRELRVRLTLQLANEDRFDGPRRQFFLPAAAAKRLNVKDGDFIEVTTGKGAAVRGWTKVGDGADETLSVGPSSLQLLAATPGDRVEIRTVPREPA